jgi:hypothetical protein
VIIILLLHFLVFSSSSSSSSWWWWGCRLDGKSLPRMELRIPAGNPFHSDHDAQIGRAAHGLDSNQQTFSPLMFAVNTEPATLGT